MKYLIGIIALVISTSAIADHGSSCLICRANVHSFGELRAVEVRVATRLAWIAAWIAAVEAGNGVYHNEYRAHYKYGDGTAAGHFEDDLKFAAKEAWKGFVETIGEPIAYGLKETGDGISYGAMYMAGDEYGATAAWMENAANETASAGKTTGDALAHPGRTWNKGMKGIYNAVW